MKTFQEFNEQSKKYYNEGVKDTLSNIGQGIKKWWNKPIMAPPITKDQWDKRVKDKTTHELTEPKKKKK